MKTKFLLIVVFVVGVLFVVTIFINYRRAPEPKTVGGQKNISFSKLSPGKSNEEEILKTEGEPFLRKIDGNKKYFYYTTKSPDFKDEIILENGKEVFAVENIFDSSQGSYDSFRQAFGDGDVYFDDSPFQWQVFLQNGVAIQTDGKDVLKITYFESGNDSFTKPLGLQRKRTIEEVLRP